MQKECGTETKKLNCVPLNTIVSIKYKVEKKITCLSM